MYLSGCLQIIILYFLLIKKRVKLLLNQDLQIGRLFIAEQTSHIVNKKQFAVKKT